MTADTCARCTKPADDLAAVKAAARVVVVVNGRDDVCYATLTKRAAYDLLRSIEGQLTVCVVGDTAYIDRSY